jgi:hypothetical protein
MYVKDPNGKYRLVEKKDEQPVPQNELMKVLQEATELIHRVNVMLEQQK